MSADNERVPDLLVELYALGELGPEQAKEVEKRLEGEEGGLERLAAIRSSNEEILDEYPVGVMSRRIERLAELQADRRSDRPYASASTGRNRLVLAAAALVLAGVAVAFVLAEDGGARATSAGNSDQGGVIEDVFGSGDEESQLENQEDSERAWRNARAKKLKEKLERGKEVSAEDDEVTGLIRAMERKAQRARERGDVAEMTKTCEAAREIGPGACPWLEEALAAAEAGELVDGGIAEDLSEEERSEQGRRAWQEATKSLLKGDNEEAVELCKRGIALGEKRCHRILAISYKEQGDEEQACEHFREIGITTHDGLVCD